jgi:hypothetical protein
MNSFTLRACGLHIGTYCDFRDIGRELPEQKPRLNIVEIRTGGLACTNTERTRLSNLLARLAILHKTTRHHIPEDCDLPLCGIILRQQNYFVLPRGRATSALSNAAPAIYFSGALRKHIILSRLLILIQILRQKTFLNV